jgi:hypothetical protein
MKLIEDLSKARGVDPLAIQVSAETVRALPCAAQYFRRVALRPAVLTGAPRHNAVSAGMVPGI